MLVNVEVRLEAASFCVLETKTCGIQYLSLYLPSVCMSVRLAICLSICLGFCLSVFLSVCLVCLFVSLSACLFFCLSVCPSASFYPSHSFFKQSYSFVSCNRFYLSDLRLPVDDCLVLGKRLPIFFSPNSLSIYILFHSTDQPQECHDGRADFDLEGAARGLNRLNTG